MAGVDVEGEDPPTAGVGVCRRVLIRVGYDLLEKPRIGINRGLRRIEGDDVHDLAGIVELRQLDHLILSGAPRQLDGGPPGDGDRGVLLPSQE